MISRKNLPATLRAALPMSLYEVFRAAMQAGAKAPRKIGTEVNEGNKDKKCGVADHHE
jgi:hypothetical protein